MSPRSIAITGSLLILSIVAIYSFLANKKNEPAPNTIESVVENERTQGELYADSDRDGLKNWQETLLKTDSTNPDTDEDGTSDGDEISQNRDPLKKPPDETGTDYATLISGTPSDFSTARNIPSPTPTNTPTAIQNSPEIAKLKNYGNAMGKILGVDYKQSAKEAEAFNAVIKEPRAEDFDALAKIAAYYMGISEIIDGISPPSKASNIHKSIVSSYAKQAAAIYNLVSYKSVLAIPVTEFQSYADTVTQTNKSLLSLINFFSSEGVIFTSSDPGFIFNLPAQ